MCFFEGCIIYARYAFKNPCPLSWEREQIREKMRQKREQKKAALFEVEEEVEGPPADWNPNRRNTGE